MFCAAVALREILDRLWELRRHREDDWVGILDQARTALEQLAAAGIEDATADQCWALQRLVEEHLSPATKSPDDLAKAVRLVAQAGLDPHSGLGALADA
jgi:hypothetical protein